MSLVVLALVFLVGASAGGVHVSVDVENPLTTVEPHFVGVTTDWWTHNDPRFGEKWGVTGAGTLDLKQPRFNALVNTLARNGFTWRIGGTPADYILYQWANGTWPKGCPGVCLCLWRLHTRACVLTLLTSDMQLQPCLAGPSRLPFA